MGGIFVVKTESHKVDADEKYENIFKDGINLKLLNLDLKFNELEIKDLFKKYPFSFKNSKFQKPLIVRISDS